MHNRIVEMMERAQGAEWEIRKIQSDPRFTQQHKLQAMAEIRSQLNAAVAESTRQAMAEAQTAVDAAQAAWGRARTEYELTLDPARQAVAHTEAQVLASTAQDAEQVLAAAADAQAVGDIYRLRALANVALPVLIEKHSHGVTNMDTRSAYRQLRERITGQLASMEPELVRQTRAALEAAESDMEELSYGLSSIQFQRTIEQSSVSMQQQPGGMFDPASGGVRIREAA